jgi:hypothetical protein
MGAKLGGQRLDPLPESIALVGQRQLGAVCPASTSYAPSNRAIVGDAHHEPTLALHQCTGTGHGLLYLSRRRRASYCIGRECLQEGQEIRQPGTRSVCEGNSFRRFGV